MTDGPGGEGTDPRPRATGWFVDPDEIAVPLLLALGRVLFAAAGLEKALQLELVRLLHARLTADGGDLDAAYGKQIARFEGLTAGGLLAELRKYDLATDLHDRIDDAIRRRNDLVHRPFEDAQLTKATGGGETLDAVTQRLNQLAIDCGELAVELIAYAIPKIEELLGIPRAELVKTVISTDPSTVADPRDRKQLEAILALGDPQSLYELFERLGGWRNPSARDTDGQPARDTGV